MAKYIVYCLNEEGGFVRSLWIEADTDEHALEDARAMHLPNGCEVWERNRFVGSVDGLHE